MEGLDDLAMTLAIDRSGTATQIENFVKDLEKAVDYPVDLSFKPGSICLSGIGGSAMAADIILDLVNAQSAIPVMVNRNVTMPKWVDDRTLSIITSYSGNTQEALDALNGSIKAGCRICCITSGGSVLEKCEQNDIPFIKVPSGIQPRAALGHLLGAEAAILERVGVGSPASELRRAAHNSHVAVQRMSPESPQEKNIAKKLAVVMHDSIPVVYAPKSIRSVAVRWQNQINENSKMVAFSGEIPEMNHNQLVGWLQGDRCNACRPVFLLPSMMDPTIERMTMVTIQMFNESKLNPVVVPLHGNTLAENLLTGLILGDHISYYLALLKGVDPGPVGVIQDFKKRIA